MQESTIQSQIMLAMCRSGAYVLRVNAGEFWGGKIIAHTGDKLLLGHPTKIQGAPKGTSDLIGCRTVTVTPEMVGKQVGIFVALEVKKPGESPRPEQLNYLDVMRRRGAITGWARSPDEALRILEDGHGYS